MLFHRPTSTANAIGTSAGVEATAGGSREARSAGEALFQLPYPSVSFVRSLQTRQLDGNRRPGGQLCRNRRMVTISYRKVPYMVR